MLNAAFMASPGIIIKRVLLRISIAHHTNDVMSAALQNRHMAAVFDDQRIEAREHIKQHY